MRKLSSSGLRTRLATVAALTPRGKRRSSLKPVVAVKVAVHDSEVIRIQAAARGWRTRRWAVARMVRHRVVARLRHQLVFRCWNAWFEAMAEAHLERELSAHPMLALTSMCVPQRIESSFGHTGDARTPGPTSLATCVTRSQRCGRRVQVRAEARGHWAGCKH